MANNTEVAKKQFNIRLDESTIKALKKLADADSRTTSNYVEKLLTHHIEQEGTIRPKKRVSKGIR